jgi:hypothetical protein
VARTAAGPCSGRVGARLVAGLGRADGASLAGLRFLLGTGGAFSWYTCTSKSFLGMCTPVELTAVISVAGAIWALAPMLAEIALGNGFDGTGPRSWLMVLTGIGNSVIAYRCGTGCCAAAGAAVGRRRTRSRSWGRGCPGCRCGRAASTTFVPGAVLVLAGVYAGLRHGRERQKASPGK